jgi:asparagine synthetase B (glutamine-hydrolysing)
MCGIAGFSLSKTSKINVRRLSNALLSELDTRGNQASGFAFQTHNAQGLYKKAVAGAALSLKSLPRNSKTVILHTRYATHGSINVPANNHPVQSPDQSISLVHNGVIYNHNIIRKELAINLPEVDSSVIPALLEAHSRDTDKFSMLDGDAAVAWLDDNELGVLRVARISHSPLIIATLKDGSFVFASTEDILTRALKKAGLKATFQEIVPERTVLTVKAGRLDEYLPLPEADPEYADNTFYSASYYRNLTSGNKLGYATDMWAEDYEYENYSGSYSTSGSDITPKYVKYQSAWGDVEVPASWLDKDYHDPEVEGLTVNEYGEYFDSSGNYVGVADDLVEMGFLDSSYYEQFFVPKTA